MQRATLQHVPELTVAGDTYTRARQYGKALGPQLSAFYDWFVKAEPEAVMTTEYRRILADVEAVVADVFPQLFDTARGWADGAGMPYDKCRLLVFHNEIKRAIRMGCSNVIALDGPQGPWMARNCDLYADEREWQVMVHNHCDDCYDYAGVHYLGLPVSLGANQAGLVIGGSSLPAKSPPGREVFPNFAGYLLQQHASVAECMTTIQAMGHLGTGHLALLDASGDAAAVEFGNGTYHVRRADERGYLVVTNHSPSGVIQLPDNFSPVYIENSRCRYDRLCERLAATPPSARTTAFGWSLLADRDGTWPVCEQVPDGFHTIHSFVASPGLTRSEQQWCWGYPGEAPVRSVTLHA
jgi:hypothetical protein